MLHFKMLPRKKKAKADGGKLERRGKASAHNSSFESASFHLHYFHHSSHHRGISLSLFLSLCAVIYVRSAGSHFDPEENRLNMALGSILCAVGRCRDCCWQRRQCKTNVCTRVLQPSRAAVLTAAQLVANAASPEPLPQIEHPAARYDCK